MTLERLDKIVANLGYNSRKGAGIMIKQGLITIDNQVIKNPAHKIDPRQHECKIDGQEIDPLPPLTLAFNKPTGVICDRDGFYPNIFEYLPHRWQIRHPGFSCAGRLDKDSRGLVILSEDGQLVHKIISPNVQIPKIYKVTLDKELKDSHFQKIRQGGMVLERKSKVLRPAKIEALDECVYEVTLFEGQHRQIRRMMKNLQRQVLDLQRMQIGNLNLASLDLKEGEFRRIEKQDIDIQGL